MNTNQLHKPLTKLDGMVLSNHTTIAGVDNNASTNANKCKIENGNKIKESPVQPIQYKCISCTAGVCWRKMERAY